MFDLLPIFTLGAVVLTFLVWGLWPSKKKPSGAAGAESDVEVPVLPTHPVIVAAGTAASEWAAIPIESVRQALGPTPRKLEPELTAYWSAVPPFWLTPDSTDELRINFDHRERVRREGVVVWAAIVQANNVLFERGAGDAPASVIFSLDPYFDTRGAALGEIAGELFALKNTDQADPQVNAFARMITSELTRGMRFPIPKRFTEGREVFHSSVMVHRKHLPKGYVAGQLMPVLVDREKTGALMIVPAAYWPASLLGEW